MRGSQEPIRITEEEAFAPRVDDLLKRQASLRGVGITKNRSRKWYYSNWFAFSIAGSLFAFLSWVTLEPFFDDVLYIQGQIEQIEEGPNSELKVVGLLPITGTIKVDGVSMLVFSPTQMATPDGIKPIDLTEFHVGDEVGFYVDSYDDRFKAGYLYRVEKPTDPTKSSFNSLATQQKTTESIVLVFFAIVSAFVGLGVGAADGLMCRLMRRALLCGGAGMVLGFIGGFVSGNLAEVVYMPISVAASSMRDTEGQLTTIGFLIQVAGRALAWALAGMTMGLGQGIVLRSGKLILYGMLGGLIGGMFGGMLFDPIQVFIVGRESVNGDLSRLIGIVVVGLFVGLMIGIVELLARDAWLNMVRGPLAGKEFLVFKDVVKIGASPSSDIYLFNDEDVSDHHATIRSLSDQYEIEAVSHRQVLVNGRPITLTKLRHGDQIQLGDTVFAFQRRSNA